MIPTMKKPRALALAGLLCAALAGPRPSAWAQAPQAAPAPPLPAGAAVVSAAAPAARPGAGGGEAASPPSSSARQIFERARSQLVQIRTVLKGRASQASVGSGFFVTPEGHIVTNFHVVAQAALKPRRYDLVYVAADGREAPAVILQIDARHDLALLKAGDAAGRRFDALPLRAAGQALAQGERIYSLGNPLDVGFAVTEGNYNGLVKRSFYPQIFFGGALSAGMSGGPALDDNGQVIGVNVARRVDGEQVSFLVPASFAQALLADSRDARPLVLPAYPALVAQLLQHQEELSERFIGQGWKPQTHPRYRVPVPNDEFMRCWGNSQASRNGGMSLERSDCVMDTRIFAGDFSIGWIAVRHESYDGSKIGPLRYAMRNAQSFGNENLARVSAYQTPPQCREDFIDRAGLTLRAVICLRAYKKLPQLYDVTVLVATLDQSSAGVQGRFDAKGVSFANAQRLARYYLDAYAWN
jgi:S1-C subfamily serine protease